MKNALLGMLLAVLAAAVVLPAQAADKGRKFVPAVKNSYGSEVALVGETGLRVTTRSKVQGTLDEINTPGTSTYKAFQNVINAAMYRAAVEANALGYKALKVSATHNRSQTTERRSASSCPGNICEKDFSFAPGNYVTDVELALELILELHRELPADAAAYIDVDYVLSQLKK